MQNEQYTPQSQSPPPVTSAPPATAPRDRRDMPYKLPWLAGFLSGIFPGVGQVYVGYYRQGIIFGLIFVSLITALSNNVADGLEPLFGLSMGFLWIFGIIDAARRAQAVNRVLDGYGDQPIPDDLPLPASGGSVMGGGILMALGAILLIHLQFDWSLQWLEDWWPLGLIILGGWLFWRGRQEKATATDRRSGGSGGSLGA